MLPSWKPSSTTNRKSVPGVTLQDLAAKRISLPHSLEGGRRTGSMFRVVQWLFQMKGAPSPGRGKNW